MLAFSFWIAIVLSAFYITQHPLFFQVISGIGATLWAIALTILLLVNSAGLGTLIIKQIRLQANAQERLLLGTGLGLGVLGFCGYGLGAAGLASAPILALFLFCLLIWIIFSKTSSVIWSDLHSLINPFRQRQNDIPRWLAPAVLVTVLL